jgi:hypothetical protein
VKELTPNTEKKFKRYDMQDESDFAIETLTQMKAWITDWWKWNEDEDMTEKELNKFFEDIKNADEKELFEILAGIDYTFDELDGEGNVIEREVVKLQTNMSDGYSVISEKTDDTLVTIQVIHKGNKIRESVTTVEKMIEEHRKNVDGVLNDIGGNKQ